MENKKQPDFKFHVRKGDKVMVITGKSKGKTGVILEIIREEQRAIVEGLNLKTKHIKPSAKSPEGGIEKISAGIHISNLMLLDPKTGEPTRIGRKRDSNGKLRRYSKKTSELIVDQWQRRD